MPRDRDHRHQDDCEDETALLDHLVGNRRPSASAVARLMAGSNAGCREYHQGDMIAADDDHPQ